MPNVFALVCVLAASLLGSTSATAASLPAPARQLRSRAAAAAAAARAERLLASTDDPNSVIPAGKDVEVVTDMVSISLSQLVAFLGMILLIREANKYARGESNPIIGVGASSVPHAAD
jgi:hypothetical protein